MAMATIETKPSYVTVRKTDILIANYLNSTKSIDTPLKTKQPLVNLNNSNNSVIDQAVKAKLNFNIKLEPINFKNTHSKSNKNSTSGRNLDPKSTSKFSNKVKMCRANTFNSPSTSSIQSFNFFNANEEKLLREAKRIISNKNDFNLARQKMHVPLKKTTNSGKGKIYSNMNETSAISIALSNMEDITSNLKSMNVKAEDDTGGPDNELEMILNEKNDNVSVSSNKKKVVNRSFNNSALSSEKEEYTGMKFINYIDLECS